MKYLIVCLLLVGCAGRQKGSATPDRRDLEGRIAALEEKAARVDALEKKVATLERQTEILDELLTWAAAIDRKVNSKHPDPNAVYSVPIDGDPVSGPTTALVTIVEGAEFACPYCEQVRATLHTLQGEYKGKVRLVFKNFVIHEQVATTPALAACAAGRQGKFWEMSELIWQKGYGKNDLSEANMHALAGELKLDLSKFKTEMAGEACLGDIQTDMDLLGQLGVEATPAFFINGRFLSGAQDIDTFRGVIDEELKKAEAATKKGKIKPQKYLSLIHI